MPTANRFGSAASLIALSAMIGACAAPQVQTSGLGGRTADDIGLATRAALALGAKDVPTAIGLAERAVAKTPDDAGFRALLGNAYFAGGRFWSAESAYKDALALYSNQPQVVLKLALTEIALGKNNQAIAFLEAGRTVLPVADYGLALALAGRPAEAVEVLGAAARETGADSRVRQNLALAYALTGDWTEARTVAAQDVPANQLDSRIQQWMLLAKPAKASDQVASLVGVSPATIDHGQPMQLALNKPDTRLAQAAPPRVPASLRAQLPAPVAIAPVALPEPVAVPQPQVAEAVPTPPPFPQFSQASAEVPPPPPPADPDLVQASAPMPVTTALIAAASHVRSAFAALIPHKAVPAAKPRKVLAQAAAQPARRGTSPAVVQLGAYGSPERVLAAWTNAARSHSALKAYMPVSARFESSHGTVYRLSVKGFANAGEASALCTSLRQSGGSCFVRTVAGDAPVHYAAR
ncbi:MAG: tetratricopeptide repeat protein [Sphingomicrobium sp.]